ncbi:MAG TPA: gliding motility-associated C-terminal domain-containing protein [Oligoflexia bacterium]|nr:gliding motility-associated C-terminal domain-containing protein [Oligoflexia bacterium]HMR25215.1 gliding motility-associated C-terminal domain-containing protein [Oligoflexia bacterium]
MWGKLFLLSLVFISTAFGQVNNIEPIACGQDLDANDNFDTEYSRYSFVHPAGMAKHYDFSLHAYLVPTFVRVSKNDEELFYFWWGPTCEENGPGDGSSSGNCMKGPLKAVYDGVGLTSTSASELAANGGLTIDNYPVGFNEAAFVPIPQPWSPELQQHMSLGTFLLELNLPASETCDAYKIELIAYQFFTFPYSSRVALDCQTTGCPTQIPAESIVMEDKPCGKEIGFCGDTSNIFWIAPNGRRYDDVNYVAQESGIHQYNVEYPGCPVVTGELEIDVNAVQDPVGSFELESKRYNCIGGTGLITLEEAQGLNYPINIQWYQNNTPLENTGNWNAFEVPINDASNLPGYRATITDNQGCRVERDIDLEFSTPPTATADGNLCTGEDVQIHTEPRWWNLDTTYHDNVETSWTRPDGSTQDTNVLNVELSDATEGEYTYTMTFDRAGCTVSNTYDLQGSDMEANIVSPGHLCENEGFATVNVTNAEGEVVYEWSNGESTQGIENLSPGHYTVEVTDDKGCTVEDRVHITTANYKAEFKVPSSCPYPLKPVVVVTRDNYQVRQTALDITAEDLGQVTLLEYQYAGCQFEEELEMPDRLYAHPIYIPNAFSPNGDNINDVFKIYNDERPNIHIVSFEIYTRKGDLFYREVDKALSEIEGWDGGQQNGRPANTGAYVYKVVQQVEGCDEQIHSGIVNLIK